MSDAILFLLPGAMYLWVLFLGQSPLQEIVREKETHVLSRLLSCPVSSAEYVLAKLLRTFVLSMISLVLLLITSALLFNIHWGNPLRLALTVVAIAGSMTGLLAMIYGLVRTREQSSVLPPLVILTLGMIGGSMFPFENLPAFLQNIGRFTPNHWGVTVLRAAARSAPSADVLWAYVALTGLAFAGSFIGFLLFRRQLANAS